MICLCVLVNSNESSNTINKSLKQPKLQQQHSCFCNVNGNFHIVFFPPEPQWNGIYPSVLLWQKAPSTTTMALGDLRCITGLTLDCWLTNKWNWSLINIWNRIYQHSTREIKPKTRCDFGGTWQLRFIRNSVRVPAQPPHPKLYFSTSNEPQLPHFLSKLAFNINWSRRSINSQLTEQAPLQSEPRGVACSDINKYDKHLSWSCIQWEGVWFNIKRHISADRRKRERFISDKWGGEEFWKFPSGCNNNWSQTFLLYMCGGGDTGGLTYLIGHVKTTRLGQENRGMPWETQHFNSTNSTLAPNKKTQIEAGGTHPTGSPMPLSDICWPLPCLNRGAKGK